MITGNTKNVIEMLNIQTEGVVNTYFSDIAIGGGRLVGLDSQGRLRYVDVNDLSTIKNILGITKNAANPTQAISVQTTGKYQDSSFNFIIGDSLYASVNGLITNSINNNIVLKIGTAVNSNTILLKLSIPIINA